MNLIDINIIKSGRKLACTSGLALGTVQGVINGTHSPTLATLEIMAGALGYPKKSVLVHVRDFFATPPASVALTSREILRRQGEWAVPFFEFVDRLRATKNTQLIADPPVENTMPRFKALLAATVETLCDGLRLDTPWWCQAMPVLNAPWFMSGVENLKAAALVESPVPFRRRGIFVLGNFLRRA